MKRLPLESRQGFTLVEIMIVVAIISLLAAIAIPNLVRAKMTGNDAYALGSLKNLSTACENFALDTGAYPTSLAALTGATPAYIEAGSVPTGTTRGYIFTYTWGDSGYTFNATAATCGTSGNRNFTITTGAVLNNAAC